MAHPHTFVSTFAVDGGAGRDTPIRFVKPAARASLSHASTPLLSITPPHVHRTGASR